MNNISVRSDSKINYMSKTIARDFLHRGTATAEKLSATMRLAKEETGLRNLGKLENSDVVKIVSNLKEKFQNGQLSGSAVNSYVSSLNNIIKYIGKDGLNQIKASDFSLSRNVSEKDNVNKENLRSSTEAFKSYLENKYEQTKDIRYEALKHAVSIQSANLRLRESLLIKLQSKNLSQNTLKISEKGDGSKNSRAREIKLNTDQKAALNSARDFLKRNDLKNLNFGTIQKGRDFANSVLKAFRQANPGISFHFHGERHFAAHEAYRSAWAGLGYQLECRARTGESKADWVSNAIKETGLSKAEFEKFDKEIRQNISRDLGHERIGITSRYLG